MKNSRQSITDTPAFLQGGGEMGALTRDFNWSATAIGHYDQWPQSLCSLVGVLLGSRFPMMLLWGDDLIQFYNDAFRPSLGNEGKHPLALGQKAEDCWSEIWDIINPLFNQVLKGESVWFEDSLIPIFRNGNLENVYWTFSYSPIRDAQQSVKGILVVCNETTDKVNNTRRISETRDQLAFAIDAAELGTWDLNPVSYHFTGNERVREWFGLGSGDYFDLDWAVKAIAEKDRARVGDAIHHALQFESGGNYDIEYTIIHPETAEERVVRARGKALFDEQQKPYRFNGILHDITKEVSARTQRQRLLTLVDNSVDLMAILEMNGTNSYINSAGRELLGIDPDSDVTTIPISDFHTPEQLAFVESEILPNVMSKGRWAGQFAIRNGKTGEIIPLFNNCHRIDDLNTGAPIGVGAVMRDMRPEINARRELAENEARMNMAIETSGLGMWELDLSTSGGIFNPRYLEIFGFDKNAQPDHVELLTCIHPDDREIRDRLMEEALETGQLDYEMRIIRLDGSLRWLKVRGKTLYNEVKQPVKMLGTIMDFTDQKMAAQQLEEKVNERTRELQEANAELEKKNKELASFAYVSSHDLQEPLRKINTFISRVEEEKNSLNAEKQQEYFSRIKLSAMRMQQLINDLLSFSRTSTSEKNYVRKDLTQLVEEVLRDLNENIQRSGTIVHLEKLSELMVIEFQFHQLLTNIISNAIKFSKKNHANHVRITGTHKSAEEIIHLGASSGNYYHLTIADTGIGFEEKYASRIFEVFQRLHGRNDYEGTGIGLAICKKIVENHQGFIEAEGKPNAGASFHIYIPVMEPA